MRSARFSSLPHPGRPLLLLAAALCALLLCSCASRYGAPNLDFDPRFTFVDSFSRDSGSWEEQYLLFRDTSDRAAREMIVVVVVGMPTRTQSAMQVLSGTVLTEFSRAELEAFVASPVEYTRRMDDQRDGLARVRRGVHWAMQRLTGLGLPVHETYAGVVRGYKMDDDDSKGVAYLCVPEALPAGAAREAELLKRFEAATGLEPGKTKSSR